MKKFLKALVQYYLKILTKIALWRHKPLVIAVIGSTNKTFVKEAILDELGRGSDVRGNPKSFNTEIGLPLAVLFLPSGYASVFKWVDILLAGTSISFFSRKFPKVLVLEMGVGRRGDMDYLLSMVQPTIVIATNIAKSLPDTRITLDDIAREMRQLVVAVPKHGKAILNADDRRVRRMRKNIQAKVVLYGIRTESDARISNIKTVAFGQKFSLEIENEKQEFEIERHGRHNIEALAIAKIVARELEKIGHKQK